MISVLTLFVAESADTIFKLGLELAQALGLPVTSWRTGDPTRSLYKYLAVKLATVDQTVANLARSAFLSAAVAAANAGVPGAKEWLKILALEVYGVTPQEATYATGTVTLVNNGGGFYPREAGDLAFKSTITGKTYHSTSAGTIASGPATTATFDFIADEPGSDSALAADELDELVTKLLGVEVQSNTAAPALDEESADSIAERCNDSLGALSPNGPLDAYRYVAKNSELTGLTTITRAISIDNEDGTVTVFIAGPAGAVTGGEVTTVQDAIDTWATPNCVTATVFSATAVVLDVDATVAYTGSLSDEELEELMIDKVTEALGKIDIGGEKLIADAGEAKGIAYATIYQAVKSIDGVTSVTLTIDLGSGPVSVDIELEPNQVPTIGDLTLTVV